MKNKTYMTPEIAEDTRFVLLSEGWKALGDGGLFTKGGRTVRFDECKYWSSFDWLNPAWSKTILELNKIACKLLDATIMSDDEAVQDENEDAVRRIDSLATRYHRSVDCDRPADAFSTLVEAIKLLNNHKKVKELERAKKKKASDPPKRLAVLEGSAVVTVYETTDTYTAYELNGDVVTRVPHSHGKIKQCFVVRVTAPGVGEYVTEATTGFRPDDPERDPQMSLTLKCVEHDTHCGEPFLLASKAEVDTLHYAYVDIREGKENRFVLVAPVKR